jgi:isopentenyl-diphosphate delta-isomerase
MTGGSPRAATVNARLAAAAVEHGLGMALGSGRALLADPSLTPTYVPGPRPSLLLANLGAVQLRLGVTPADAERLVDLLGADGLVLHLNPVQEAIQPEGDTTFGGLLEAIERVVTRLRPRPVVAKEVGFGLAPAEVVALLEAGVAAVDVAGAGGTNWALVEGQRDDRARDVAAAFGDWGWPTARLLPMVAPLTRSAGVPLVASGGVGDGVEAAVALALGADLVGLARPFLLAALDDQASEAMGVVIEQLRIATWAAGVPTPSALGAEHLQPA